MRTARWLVGGDRGGRGGVRARKGWSVRVQCRRGGVREGDRGRGGVRGHERGVRERWSEVSNGEGWSEGR